MITATVFYFLTINGAITAPLGFLENCTCMSLTKGTKCVSATIADGGEMRTSLMALDANGQPTVDRVEIECSE